MNNTMTKLIVLVLASVSFLIVAISELKAELPLGKVPVTITLDGDDGGRVSGGKWSSTEITGKVFCLMYVDPDEKDINAHVEKAMKAKNFPRDKFASIAMINMGATWKPNFVINSILEGKQEDFPHTIYVRDMDETIADKWNLKTDTYDIVLFNKKGEVIMSKDGEFSADEVKKLITLIKENL